MKKLDFRESYGKFIRQASKIIHEWNGHPEIFSCPQVIKNSSQYLPLRKDILQTENSRWVLLLL